MGVWSFTYWQPFTCLWPSRLCAMSFSSLLSRWSATVSTTNFFFDIFSFLHLSGWDIQRFEIWVKILLKESQDSILRLCEVRTYFVLYSLFECTHSQLNILSFSSFVIEPLLKRFHHTHNNSKRIKTFFLKRIRSKLEKKNPKTFKHTKNCKETKINKFQLSGLK